MIALIMCDSNFFLAKIGTEGQFEAYVVCPKSSCSGLAEERDVN
jgi:hypothetical protein